MARVQSSMGEFPQGLPMGRRSPRGTLRWYFVSAPEGREAQTCDRVRAIVDSALIEDAFVPRKEHWFKHGSTWKLQQLTLFKGYFVIATKNARALQKALEGLSFPVRLAGKMDRGYMPMTDDVQDFLATNMDASHVIRNSTGEIVGDRLHVLAGPLAGQESRVRRVNRHMRRATVRVSDGGDDFLQVLALSVPERR